MKVFVKLGVALLVIANYGGATPQARIPGHQGVGVEVSPATAALSGGQSIQFSATISGQADQTVSWSISPSVGTISSSGLYTAPASVASVATILATATDATHPSLSATVAISLYPVTTVSLSPAAVTLTASQLQQFTPVVNGTINSSVTWSLSPALGAISAAGLYTAPATINSQQLVLVTATSVSDPTKSYSSAVSLQPVVSVTLTPSSATVSTSQTQQLYPSVTGTTDPSVRWTLVPALGSISPAGLYTPPASVQSTQTVTVAAVSVADPNRFAKSTLTIKATVPLSLNPNSVTLGPSETQQFLASTATGPANVSWSLSPNLGTVSGVGTYFAPATLNAPLSVTITATSLVDPTQSVSASIFLQPQTSQNNPPPPPSSSPIKLPVEVLGPTGYTVSVPLSVSSVPAGAQQLSVQMHGLHYATEASLQVNHSAWTPVTNTTVNLLGLAMNHGGIGGGFSTFDITVDLPAGTIVAGTNTVNFRFNGTDGRTSGFRILKVNLLVGGTALIPSSAFVYDDPNTWTAPSTLPSDISAGKSLWYTAALTTPNSSGTQPILAHCTDCHAQDGRDLKYFNYSNNSIVVRSQFHGLSAAQGNQIASYIRSLNVPNPGRPWNPPYQPGPGLDSQPVADWAAGAGLDAVLHDDGDMLPYLMPGGDFANWAPLGNLNVRETPITLQLPDWNSWLPGIHPMDGFGSAFTSSTLFTNYQSIRANLKPNDPVSYSDQAIYLWLWLSYDKDDFYPTVFVPNTDPLWSNPQYANSMLSLRAWDMTKLWEINQEFGLEGMAKTVFGRQADSRAWFSELPFFVSPNLISAPPTGVVGNGAETAFLYSSMIWYQVQLILNWSNNRGTAGTGTVVGISSDFPYVFNHIDGFEYIPDVPAPQGLLTIEWLIKGLQSSENGLGPQAGSGGWEPTYSTPWRLATYATLKWANNLSDASVTSVMNTYLKLWLAKATSYSPAQFYAGGWATQNDVIDPTDMYGSLGNSIAYTIPVLRHYGVDPTLLSGLANWAQGLWPGYNWNALLSAVCFAGKQAPLCTP